MANNFDWPMSPLPRHLARRQRLAKQVIKLVAGSSRGYLARPLSVILVVIVVLINGMNLPADLARGNRCGMDIGVSGIRGKCIHQCVEVPGCNVPPRDCYDIGCRPPACHGSTIRWAHRVPGVRLPKFEQKNTRIPPESRDSPKWISASVTVPVSGGVVPTF
jgi:hypothetical protein